MENSGGGALLRNRRFESFLNTSSGLKRLRNDVYTKDDGWVSIIILWIRIVTCFVSMMVTTFIWALIMVVLIPWPYERIKQGNNLWACDRLIMWILGNPKKIEGAEYSNERAIYISNHASPIDIFLIMWLTPIDTIGIAKEEVIIVMWPCSIGIVFVLDKALEIDIYVHLISMNIVFACLKYLMCH
ncbi:hypothetical protein GYH30_044467 [Glycine max]|uniref:Phospholipid/glycerol acyltransferase domain-containing protein n=1 Tax=Glycine max TaxID=3847 RepID=K7MFU4_SOYBN|nr:hypothetical protein GYH30_044467 [Glycine max]